MRTEKTDKIVRMPRLIWDVAGRTAILLGIAMSRLKSDFTCDYSFW